MLDLAIEFVESLIKGCMSYSPFVFKWKIWR